MPNGSIDTHTDSIKQYINPKWKMDCPCGWTHEKPSPKYTILRHILLGEPLPKEPSQ